MSGLDPKSQDFAVLLTEHEAQIGGIRAEIGDIKSSIKAIADAVNTLTLATSRSPFDMGKSLTVIRDGIFIMAATVSFVIYVTTGHFAPEWARQAEFNKQTNIEIEALRASNRTRLVP